MTPTITPLNGRQITARDWRVTCAFAGRSKKWASLRRSSCFVQRDEETRASCASSFRAIPTYEEGDLAMFQSGVIVFHIAERHGGLLPDDANARARAITWMFAALSTVEPPIVDREIVTYAERDKSWRDERMAMVEDRIRVRLGELSARLGRADWLDGAFSAADLLMVHVVGSS